MIPIEMTMGIGSVFTLSIAIPMLFDLCCAELQGYVLYPLNIVYIRPLKYVEQHFNCFWLYRFMFYIVRGLLCISTY